jgi:hypothetical protein
MLSQPPKPTLWQRFRNFVSTDPRPALSNLQDKFRTRLKEERIQDYQAFYYPMIATAGIYCWLVADDLTTALNGALGGWAYNGWLALNIVCPILARLGRRLTANAAKKAEGEANPGVAGALLQLTGDGGVFGAIVIYFICFCSVFYWGMPMYTTFFFLMGIPGGFLFTLRSVQRWLEIRRREKRI